MTLTAILAALALLLVLAAWWGCHWLASRMDRDDRKDAGHFD